MDLLTTHPDLAHLQYTRFRRFLGTYTIAAVLFAMVFAGLAWFFRDLATGLNALALLIHGIVLAIAYVTVRQRFTRTLTLVCASTYLLGSLFVLLQPFLFLAMLLTAFVVAAFALPFATKAHIRLIVLVSGLCGVLALLCGWLAMDGWYFLPSQLPPVLQAMLSGSATATMVPLLLVLIWQFKARMVDLATSIHTTNRALQITNDQLAAEQERIQFQLTREQALVSQATALELPVSRLAPGVALVPLVGTLDPQRVTMLQQRIIEAVQQHQARYLIIDISAIQHVDDLLVPFLERLLRGITLIGAKPVLVGIGTELAIALVQHTTTLHQMTTAATIADALTAIQHDQRSPAPDEPPPFALFPN